MDNGNGSKTVYTDAVGKPIAKPANGAELASPINLLNPDRYEFYTFDDNGDLVKRLMSLDEIKGIIATGDSDGLDLDSFTSQGYLPEKRVNEVVNTVQNVLKEEMETHKNTVDTNLTLDTPDVSDSWSMILPAVFGNSGEDIKPEKPMVHVTPDTIMLEPNSTVVLMQPQPPIVVNTTPRLLSKSTTASLPISSYFTINTTPKSEVTSPIGQYSSHSTNENIKLTVSSQLGTLSTLAVSTSPKSPLGNPTSLITESNQPTTASSTSSSTSEITVDQKPSTSSTGALSTTNAPVMFTKETTKVSPILNSVTTANEYTTTRNTEPFFTWIPSLTDLNKEGGEYTTNTQEISTLFTLPEENQKYTEAPNKEQSKIYPTTENASNEDLSTLSTQYLGYQGNTQSILKETEALEHTLSNEEKISASALLDQLLLTTNVYEINTELSENNFNKVNNDNRFETSTQQMLEQETAVPTTEKFLIQISDQPMKQDNLIQNIDNLLSQAVNNVEELLNNVNNTDKIQDILNSSYNKTMQQNQKESATLASDMLESHFTKVYEQTTTPQNVKTSTKEIITSTNYNTELTTVISEQITQTTIANELEETDTISTSSAQNDIDKSENRQPTIPFKTNVVNVDNVPPLINITIITSENMKNKSKPSPSGINSDKVYYKSENDNKNVTQEESTEIYIESVFDVSNPSTELQNATTITSESTTQISETTLNNLGMSENTKLPPKNTISNNYDNVETTSLPLKDKIGAVDKENATNLIGDKTTTIVIIKRTERPLLQDTTTYSPEITEQTTNNNVITGLPTSTETNTINELPVIDIFSLFSSTEKTNSSINSTFENKFTNNAYNNELNGNLALETVISTEKLTTTMEEISTEKDGNVQQMNKHQTNTETEKVPTLHNKTVIEDNPNKNGSMWTLVPTIAPHAESVKPNAVLQTITDTMITASAIDLGPNPMQGFGLEESTATLENDIYQFTQLCNELAFGFWKSVTNSISPARSVFISPFGVTSLLAMVFLGARGATSGEMNEILKLDDMVTFNPHLTFKSVSESIMVDADSGVATSAMVRELFSDRSKGKLLPFYKERVRAFYDGYVEEVGFREISDIIRRRTNLQVKKITGGKITEFWKESLVNLKPPLAGVNVNMFQTDCSQASSEGRDGELHFVVLPTIRQRRLIPVPAVVYKSGFLAGYEPSLDATAVSFGTKDKSVSTILVMPGQQGTTAPGDGLARLEKRLVESSFKKGAWSRLLRTLIPRPNMEVQIPRFSHRSFINATTALKKMGLHDLFDAEKADLRGLNGVPNELFLSDIIQVNSFATCGEKAIGETHHSEVYPASASSRNARNLQRYEGDVHKVFHDPLHDPTDFDLPLPLRPRQARIPEVPRLKFDRPFLYYVRHNPTGLILHMGRFNPRLLP